MFVHYERRDRGLHLWHLLLGLISVTHFCSDVCTVRRAPPAVAMACEGPHISFHEHQRPRRSGALVELSCDPNAVPVPVPVPVPAPVQLYAVAVRARCVVSNNLILIESCEPKFSA